MKKSSRKISASPPSRSTHLFASATTKVVGRLYVFSSLSFRNDVRACVFFIQNSIDFLIALTAVLCDIAS